MLLFIHRVTRDIQCRHVYGTCRLDDYRPGPTYPGTFKKKKKTLISVQTTLITTAHHMSQPHMGRRDHRRDSTAERSRADDGDDYMVDLGD